MLTENSLKIGRYLNSWLPFLLMVVITRKVDEKFENDLQELDEKFQELKAKISETRKKGKDTSIAEILCLDFTPKLLMAKATYDPEDKAKLKNILDEIKAELKEAEEGSQFFQATELIKEAYEHIRHEEFKEASVAYSNIMKRYKMLPQDLKRSIYFACLDLNKKISKDKS